MKECKCKNCGNYITLLYDSRGFAISCWVKGFIRGALDHIEWDCPYYKRKWWKFWIKD